MKLSFFVQGRPVPQGSKRHVGKGVMVEMGVGLYQWRNDIRFHAGQQMGPADPSILPLAVRLHFFFDRPKSHFGTGRNEKLVKDSAPRFHVKTPDVDKLARAALDALTGVVFVDDSQVYQLMAVKSFTSVPGVSIHGTGQGVHVVVREDP